MIANTTLYHTLVNEFHSTFEIPSYATTEDAPCEAHKLRARLIKEEYDELLAAANRLDVLDAICDLIYVVAGTAVTYHIGIAPYTSTAVKLNKPTLDGLHHRTNYVLQELYSMFPCPKNTRHGLNDLLCFLDDLARNHAFRMPEAFMAVHSNNMKKLWNEPAPAELITKRKGDKWLVRDSGGKIIKPPYHTKVDLTPYV